MRKWLAVILPLCAILVLGLPALAGPPSHKAVFVLGVDKYAVDGQTKAMDAKTFAENGRTYVPVRYLALACGVPENKIGYANGQVTLTMPDANAGDTVVKLWVGKKELKINNEAKTMDVAVLARNGRTYLPARWVAEAFGYKVDWVPEKSAVLVYPPAEAPPEVPGDLKPPVPPAQGEIDMAAAYNGTLKPPAGALSPPDEWGFPAQAVRAEFKVGSRYATVTRTDGSTYQLDLGTPCVVVGNPIGVESLKKQYPSIYNNTNSVPLPGADYGALYVPFIPVAEALGVPRENIVWDGQHLAVFGFDGAKEGYMVFESGKKGIAVKWNRHGGEVAKWELTYPLYIKNGVPMFGINSVNDFDSLLGGPGSFASVVNLSTDLNGALSYENGTAAVSGKVNPYKSHASLDSLD
ncbi:MAG: copper amine oxidase N-terminal domain-containing protein [Bacillota bacterium]|nr:copper amine oxidase N-terminal domain-containing protein [Bacillota bacterium]